MGRSGLVVAAVIVASGVQAAAAATNGYPCPRRHSTDPDKAFSCARADGYSTGQYIDATDSGCRWRVTIDFGDGGKLSRRVEPHGWFTWKHTYSEAGMFVRRILYSEGSDTTGSGQPCPDYENDVLNMLVMDLHERFTSTVVRVARRERTWVQKVPIPKGEPSDPTLRGNLTFHATKATRYVGFRRFRSIKDGAEAKTVARFVKGRWIVKKVVRL